MKEKAAEGNVMVLLAIGNKAVVFALLARQARLVLLAPLLVLGML